ncbi:MAG: chemotaxis protein CheW [Alcanivoracaceae bacterium]|nr:chemotaxis protein CheW [Alcanivoracaceae bacterium]
MANEIRGIMIPVATEKRVLLPNAIIAEVISYNILSPIENSPEWLLGNFDWRGHVIPVICYDTLSTGEKTNKGKTKRVVVIKALGDIESMPYFAMIVYGVPKLQLITQGDLQVHEAELSDSNAIASKVTIHDEMSEIPNIRFIEHVLEVAIPKKAG